jgi:hypothetical protein
LLLKVVAMEGNPASAPGITRAGHAARACERFAERAPLRFSFAAVFILFALVLALFHPSYDTNDDVLMTMIAAGQGFCPAPDEHLIFTNILVGQTLKWLYTAWPQIPWYGCYLLAVHYAAQVGVLYCVIANPLKRSKEATPSSSRTRLALYLLYFALIELAFLNNLQFTTTAFLAAQAGTFLLWLAWQRRAHEPDVAIGGPLIAAVLLLLVAALVRFESLAMALLVAAPLVLLHARRAWRAVLGPCGMAAAVAAALIALTTAYDRHAYDRDPQWRGFFAYNQLRVKFNDYRWTNYSPQTAGAFAKVGWTKNDHDMIAHWFFDDPNLYSEENLRTVLASHPWKNERLTKNYYWQTCRGLLQNRSVWALLLVAPFFLSQVELRPNGPRSLSPKALLGKPAVAPTFVASTVNRLFTATSKAPWGLVGCCAAGVLLIVVLSLNTKVLPPRVYFPILSFPLAAALLLPIRPVADVAKKNARGALRSWFSWIEHSAKARLVVALLVTGTVMGVYRQARHSMVVRRDRAALQSLLAELRPSGRELFVCWEATMPFELLSPFDNLAGWSRIPLVNLVWTQRTPWQESIKRRFEIANLAEALCDRGDLVLVATPEHRSLFVTFAKEHFGADLEFVELASAGEKLVAGRFRQRALSGATADARASGTQR